MSTDVQTLLAQAATSGIVSEATSGVLGGYMGPVVIAGASGTNPDDIMATEVTLITVLIDRSGSIRSGGLEKPVRDGFNSLIDALAGSKENDSILVATWLFDDKESVLHSFTPVKDAVRLDTKNYSGRGMTALYETWMKAITSHVAYATTLRNSGTPVRNVVVVVTDGFDTSSMKANEAVCSKTNTDLLRSETFVLAFVGVGEEGDFRTIARKMGIPDNCILVQQSTTPSDVRKTFELVSKSALRVSQGTIQPGQGAGFFT